MCTRVSNICKFIIGQSTLAVVCHVKNAHLVSLNDVYILNTWVYTKNIFEGHLHYAKTTCLSHLTKLG